MSAQTSLDELIKTRKLLDAMVAKAIAATHTGGAPSESHGGGSASSGHVPEAKGPDHGGSGNANPPRHPQGGSGSEDGGHGGVSKFFEGLTFIKVGHLVVAIIVGMAAYHAATHDTPPNKAAESRDYQLLQIEMEKTKQMKIIADSNPSTLPSVQQQAGLDSCMRLTKLNAGDGYMLPSGECFTMGTTSHHVYIGAESPFTSVTGGDFIITTNDESASCDSRKSGDRCTSWIQQNQKLGGPDSVLHKPRYWMLFKTFGNINIKSA